MNASNLLNRFWLTDRFGKMCESRPLSPDEQVFARQKTPLLPCFRDKTVSYAERLNAVGIDHLAWSMPFSVFQKLDNNAWYKLPELRNYPDTADGFDLFREHVVECEKRRLEQFVIRVLGLRLGSPRTFGRFFYTHSYELFDPKRKHVIGFVAFGGNKDTVYFQISGKGCKYVFNHTDRYRLHHWLNFFGVKQFTRIDLFYDDFDGNYSCKHAEIAYNDNAFRRRNGGPNPDIDPQTRRNGNKIKGEIVRIGSRSSDVFWRVYNKALEQSYDGVWYRSEVELKRCSIDCLLSPAKTFAGLCDYAASVNLDADDAKTLVFKQKRKTAIELQSQLKWIQRQCGRAIYDLVEDWELSAEETLICLVGDHARNGGKFSAPPIYAHLIRG
ncbi:MAG: hypothetical protein SwBeaMacB_13800 [Shewanella algae]|uniref:replication initiation factor domain-containing protein n=4 Tax=Shewanella algae TaxID=38313 RepID=UPI0034BFB76B